MDFDLDHFREKKDKKDALLKSIVTILPYTTMVFVILLNTYTLLGLFYEKSGIDLRGLVDEEYLIIVLIMTTLWIYHNYKYNMSRIKYGNIIKKRAKSKDRKNLGIMLITEKSMLDIYILKLELLKTFSVVPVGLFLLSLIFRESMKIENLIPGKMTFELLILFILLITVVIYIFMLSNAFMLYRGTREDVCKLEIELELLE